MGSNVLGESTHAALRPVEVRERRCVARLCKEFTSPTRTRQDCLVLSCTCGVNRVMIGDKTTVPCGRLSWLLVRFWAHVNIVVDMIWYDKSSVFSRPTFQIATVQSQIYQGLLKTWKLSCLVANSVHTADMDKTTRFCRVHVGGEIGTRFGRLVKRPEKHISSRFVI